MIRERVIWCVNIKLNKSICQILNLSNHKSKQAEILQHSFFKH